jgi:hypothetical protein
VEVGIATLVEVEVGATGVLVFVSVAVKLCVNVAVGMVELVDVTVAV